jgi:hypothetical protein
MKNSTTQPSNLIKVANKLHLKGYTSSAIYYALIKAYGCTKSMSIQVMKLANINF